ncbi:DUF5655 domain-containing protein [Streptomyces sp. RFCAC02]|uniref:DUF5655 domain-containing protein n=1 Tax=Streptomyces sp. RFCAC02 TaxID=2499143 RepID=UPI001020C508|nr:DUF5655 domain-containing protein [Streptomyces sp. RFCAC02]
MKLFVVAEEVREVIPRLAVVETDVQGLVEARMETLLGVRYLASEYSTGAVHGSRIDSLGLDENGAPVIVEYKRGTDAGVISQGLFYLARLLDRKDAFRRLVRDRIGSRAAADRLWSRPRLICVAGGFTRYDLHAVREHRHSIDLVRYRWFGDTHVGLETVASTVSPGDARQEPAFRSTRETNSATAELAQAVHHTLLDLGDDVIAVQRKRYRAYRRLRNFACVCTPRKSGLLVYLKADPKTIDLLPGLVRDVTGQGHHGTGNLELRLHTPNDLKRARPYFRDSYAAA